MSKSVYFIRCDLADVSRHQEAPLTEKERYQQYLCSREWGVKREAVRERCGGICERCKDNPMDAVHHLTYARKYAELLTDLQAICEACHKFTHGLSDHDPVRDAPISVLRPEGKRQGGRVREAIQSVYLAGKIEADGDWREGVVEEPDCLSDLHGVYPSVPTGDGRELRYCGPYFSDLSDGYREHGCGPHWDPNRHAVSPVSRLGTYTNCIAGVQEADLVFAWIAPRTASGPWSRSAMPPQTASPS